MSQIQQIKEVVDIIELIGQRIPLQRAGSNWRGLCPFHGEKSPSFFVSESLQRYKCFGCGESGDAFTFLEKYEGMTFYESLQLLADQAGVTLETHVRTKDDELREQLLGILNLTKEYYHYILTDHAAGEPARAYLKERGITKETIRLFQLGYALPEWEGLVKYLHRKKKYSLELMEKAGLVVQGRQGQPYDRFRDRLIFPLKNHRGQVVGFSGRSLNPDAKEAKYINSPETLLYHKSRMLFGYHELLQHIRKEAQVVVVEGEFDVMGSVQAHLNHVVAIKGSALTKDHAKLLSRVAKVVVLALDTDSAGVEATKKAIEVLRETDLELRVAELPEGKDPDDLAKARPKAWREAVKQAATAYEFLINAALKQHSPHTSAGKRAIMKELAPVLAMLDHAVELEHYLKIVGKALEVKPESVRADIEQFKSKQALGVKVPESSRTPASVTTESDSSARRLAGKADKAKSVPSRKQTLERYLLFLLFHHPPAKMPAFALEAKEVQWSLPGAKQLVDLLSAYEGSKDKNKKAGTKRLEKLDHFARSLADDLQQRLFEYYSDQKYFETLENLDLAEEWIFTLRDLRQIQTRAQIDQITKQLAELDRKAELTPEESKLQDELLRQIVVLKPVAS
jgi:DNA primase